MAQVPLDIAYPEIEFSASSRNWWAWLKGSPAECIHLDHHNEWMATLLPDTLYLRGKRVMRRDQVRPEVVLCRDCLARTLISEIVQYRGQVAAFEPDPELFTQYFFVADRDFEAAGFTPEVVAAIEKRLVQDSRECLRCSRPSRWLWFPSKSVPSLDDTEAIAQAVGEPLCAEHGARRLCDAFASIAEANLFYMNLPYGERGTYVWI